MPSKMIYVADADAPLFAEAQLLSGASLSSTVAVALGEYVGRAHQKARGLREIKVRMYKHGVRSYKRFHGVELIRTRRRGVGNMIEMFEVYQTARGQFALYRRDEPDWTWRANPAQADSVADCDPLAEIVSSFEVYPTKESLARALPDEISRQVDEMLETPAVEDLDI